MICCHCGDLLVEDRFMDWAARWRCLKCGHVQDSISVENHLSTQRKDLFVQPEGIAGYLSSTREQDLPKSSRK
jgi:hypothetical protein